MSKQDLYFTANLSILRSGKSELEALKNLVNVGIVNAGIGYFKTYGQAAFDGLIQEARKRAIAQGLETRPPTYFPLKWNPDSPATGTAEELWNYSLAGWQILNVDRGSFAVMVQTWIDYSRRGEVFFRIRSDWFWQAFHEASHEAGHDVPESKPLSWREFRILAAILSAKMNDYGFVFLGWESIKARASGFHTKELLKRNADKLPAHCQSLGRYQIEATLTKLEAMGFFARVRYSKGSRGGLTAYSFRLTRPALQDAVKQWKSRNDFPQAKVAENRAADLAEFSGNK